MLTNIEQTAGYLVVAMRNGKPVIAEGYTAHADTIDEATAVEEAWCGIGETVQVFALEPVEASPPFPPVSAVTHILNQSTYLGGVR